MGFGTDFVQPASGPGPVTNDPRYPYVTNVDAARTGKQPTFPYADVSNPNLTPFARDGLKKANDLADSQTRFDGILTPESSTTGAVYNRPCKRLKDEPNMADETHEVHPSVRVESDG